MSGPSRPAMQAKTDHIEPMRVVAFVAMVFGMFMAILDIQIVSASLAEIQAGLSASADEISWVQTSYLIAEVIMIPLSGYLSRVLSTRVMFTVSCAGFTLMSVMCAFSGSINEMIVWRALQGFIGGGMIPTVFASAYTIFPRSKLPIITPIIGLVATLAPTVGPTVGGYLTDIFSWHWLFLVNVLPGIIVSVTAWTLIDFDKPDYSLLKNFDWWGLISMAVFLGALEYVLEEGTTKEWFQSELIVYAAVASLISGTIFFWRAFTARQPIVDLTCFINRNFWTGSLFSFVLGVGLYGLTYLYPVFLARVRGYSALQIGQTMFITGVCMFIAAPITGKLMTKIDPRWMIATGFSLFAVGTLQASLITYDWDFWELLVPQILRGFGLMLAMVPINNLALGTMPPEKMKNASGLFNLTRNLGGAVGLALINTIMTDRIELHAQRLHESVAWGHTAADEMLANMTQDFLQFGSDAGAAALKEMYLLTHREAVISGLADVFYVLTWLFCALVVLAPVMRRPAGFGGGGGGH